MFLLDSIFGEGQPLQRDFQRQMEHEFGADFSEVRVHTSSRAAAFCDAAHSRACTDGRTIAFADGRYRPDLLNGRFLIAHELAHIVQKKLGENAIGSTDKADLEIEADLAALTVLTGGQAGRLTPDPSSSIANWGEPGHYYTVYMVALAAGVDPDLAFQLAYLSQLPDEVAELDAKELGIQYAAAKAHHAGVAASRSHITTRGFSGIEAEYLIPEIPEFSVSNMAKWLNIQRGAHCLTGASHNIEQYKRRAILMRNPIGSLEFGIALHAYGDVYAHVDSSGYMYSAPLGHFAAARQHHSANQEQQGDISKGCGIDFIHLNRGRYLNFGMDLYKVFREKVPGLLARMDREMLASRLTTVSDVNLVPQQIDAIKHMIQAPAPMGMATKMEEYWPENDEAKPWQNFSCRKATLTRDIGRLESIVVAWSAGGDNPGWGAMLGQAADNLLSPTP